jgi:putative FmdB family regulatory protein
MLILHDYACECGHKFEDLVERDRRDSVTCPSCGGPTKRQLSAPRLDTRLGVDAASFPTLGDRWVRNRKQRQRIEEARKREHGD